MAHTGKQTPSKVARLPAAARSEFTVGDKQASAEEGPGGDGDGTRNLAGAGPPAGFLFRRPAGPSVRVLRAADFTVRPGGWWIVSGLSGSHDSVGSQ